MWMLMEDILPHSHIVPWEASSFSSIPHIADEFIRFYWCILGIHTWRCNWIILKWGRWCPFYHRCFLAHITPHFRSSKTSRFIRQMEGSTFSRSRSRALHRHSFSWQPLCRKDGREEILDATQAYQIFKSRCSLLRGSGRWKWLIHWEILMSS